MNSNHHTQAVIHPDTQIGKNVQIGPFSFIDEDVVIGDNTWIGPNVTIFSGARIGNNVQIHPGAVIAGLPQDLKYKGEYTTTEIGDHTVVREYVTINKGTSYADKTVVGKNCLLMAYVHVAHDCILGDHVILANNVNLAGHVEIEDWAILEGMVAVQQFTRIGQHCFIAGGSLVRKNVPPFIRAAREPLSYAGVNKVGLHRRDFSAAQIDQIHDIYRILFVKSQNIGKAVEEVIEKIAPSTEKDTIIDFIRHADTGILKGFNHMNGEKIYGDQTT